jgi:cytoskeletal protein CcmA (bactofilin family)
MKLKREQLSIIDKDLNIEGTLQFKGKVLVAGTLRGDLLGERALTVKGSYMCADVKVDEISIGGTFEGNIIAHKRLRILNTGNVTGTLFCNTLIIEAGGMLNGQVKQLTTKNAVSSLEIKKAKSAP